MPTRHWPLACLLLLLLLSGCASPPRSTTDLAVADVAANAERFLRELPPELHAKAARPFEDPERTAWAFVPGRYAGVELGELDASAMQRAQELLLALLGSLGREKAMAIVQMENVLREIEERAGREASHRDPARYALLVCGEPSAEGRFGVRLQGHHLSLHFTFSDGRLAGATPQFLGSNPHELREGPNAGRRVLAAEEDLARELLASLDAAQLAHAVIDAEAPADVVLGPAAAFDALGARRGLRAAAMNEAQRAQLWRLVELFARNLRGEFAAAELARLRPQLAELCFAWAGSSERGRGHYWRVHGATFAIEYDNTQNGANHVHVVWRDLERDFGQGPLREHLERDHAGHRP